MGTRVKNQFYEWKVATRKLTPTKKFPILTRSISKFPAAIGQSQGKKLTQKRKGSLLANIIFYNEIGHSTLDEIWVFYYVLRDLTTMKNFPEKARWTVV